MMNTAVGRIIESLLTVWSAPKIPVHTQELGLDLPAKCSAALATRKVESEKTLPPDVHDFWDEYHSATLFEDVNYGQWGLRILDYETSNQVTRRENRERSFDMRRGDRVIGEFIGDSELVVVRCDNAKSDFGHILISLPTSGREEWYGVGNSLSEFLTEYIANEGRKYWEAENAGAIKQDRHTQDQHSESSKLIVDLPNGGGEPHTPVG